MSRGLALAAWSLCEGCRGLGKASAEFPTSVDSTGGLLEIHAQPTEPRHVTTSCQSAAGRQLVTENRFLGMPPEVARTVQ